jgi:hypothetical protein
MASDAAAKTEKVPWKHNDGGISGSSNQSTVLNISERSRKRRAEN